MRCLRLETAIKVTLLVRRSEIAAGSGERRRWGRGGGGRGVLMSMAVVV